MHTFYFYRGVLDNLLFALPSESPHESQIITEEKITANGRRATGTKVMVYYMNKKRNVTCTSPCISTKVHAFQISPIMLLFGRYQATR